MEKEGPAGQVGGSGGSHWQGVLRPWPRWTATPGRSGASSDRSRAVVQESGRGRVSSL